MNNKKAISMLMAGGLILSANMVQAGAVATSYLDIHDFQLTNEAGKKLVVGEDVEFISEVNNNGDTAAVLNDLPRVSKSASAPAVDGALFVPSSQVGDAGYVEDSFSFITQPNDATSNYALGDGLLTGAIVDFPGVALPNAQAQTLAEVSISDDVGSGTSAGNNVGVQGRFGFIAMDSDTVSIDFLATGYVRSLLSDDVLGLNADASISWSMSVFDVTNNVRLVNFSPDELNIGNSSTVPGDDFLYQMNGEAFSTSFGVVAGNEYQVTIDHASDANAETRGSSVPEPMPLALVSISLIGLALTKRSKSQ